MALVSASSSSVRTLEKLSLCQLLSAAFLFLKSLFGLLGMSLFGPLLSVPNFMDEVCVLIFYMKFLVILENSDITIENVDE
jgi:hypothetical protein